MPSTVTHAIFTKDVFDILPLEIRKYLDPKRIKMYGQGMDSCKFYNVRYIEYGTMEELGKFTGSSVRASISVQDKGFAEAILKKLNN